MILLEICNLLIRTIREVCARDYNYDESVITDWLSNKTSENISKWIKSDNLSYVVVCRDIIVGFAMLGLKGDILLNYVLPEYLNRGIGKILLNKMEQDARRCGIKAIKVNSSITAKKFYFRNGFAEIGPPKYMGKILGEFPMRKILTPT